MTDSGDAWSATRYADHAAFVPALGRGVLDWLAAQKGERILDLGCGDGTLTAQLVAAGADVLGVDASASMIDAARGRGLRAEIADAQALEFSENFDAVFSNAALHWMTDPDAVIAGVAKALRPGGRFVAEFGGHGNVAAIRVALASVIARRCGIADAPSGIWYFPGVDEHSARLTAGGFDVRRCELIPRPTPLPSEMRDWILTLAAPIMAKVPAAEHAAVLDEATALLRPALCDSAGRWTADYIRLRFEAVKR